MSASKKHLVLVLCLILWAIGATAESTRKLKDELDSLVKAERAFAQLSVAKGTRNAFLASLNDESILFRPEAVPGKSWTEKSPPVTSQLSWEPEFADIAAAGDLGYTTGPWEIRRTPQEAPGGFGHYVTVWKKQADGAWKIAIDIGISHAAGPKPAKVDSPKIAADIEKRRTDTQIQSARASLLDAESKFSNSFSDDARLYRNNSFPIVGQAAIRKALADTKAGFTWKLINSDISGSADLGYAYGTVELQPGEKANYLRIWKRQGNGQWKVVLDLVS